MVRSWIRSCRVAGGAAAAILWIVLPTAASDSVPAEAVKPRPLDASPRAVRDAIQRSVALIESSATEYRRQRECFSCHHQAMPVLALLEAQRGGFEIDVANLQAQITHTAAHLERGRGGYREGRGQGGQADTAGWALWALADAEYRADETTDAAAVWLLEWQRDAGHWRPASRRRLPTQGSDFTTTYIAIRSLEAYIPAERFEAFAARRERVLHWLATADAAETEDRVYRLRTLHYLTGDSELTREATRALLDLQRHDGGWGQTADRPSDAYATATALTALNEAGGVLPTELAYRRGVAYLLRGQHDDGSWRVATRAQPIQVYFESGFPHEKDQFLSMAATSWATIALVRAYEATKNEHRP